MTFLPWVLPVVVVVLATSVARVQALSVVDEQNPLDANPSQSWKHLLAARNSTASEGTENWKHLRAGRTITTFKGVENSLATKHVIQTMASSDSGLNIWKWIIIIEGIVILVCACTCSCYLCSWSRKAENQEKYRFLSQLWSEVFYETAWKVSDAGLPKFNGVYKNHGTSFGYPKYLGQHGRQLRHRNGRWELCGVSGEVRYECVSNSETIPTADWQVAPGQKIAAGPAPTLTPLLIPSLMTEELSSLDTEEQDHAPIQTCETLQGKLVRGIDTDLTALLMSFNKDEEMLRSDGKWFTALWKAMWPRVDVFLRGQLDDLIKEQLYKRLPNTSGILSVSDLSFGSSAPEVDDIFVRSRKAAEGDRRTPLGVRGLNTKVIDLVIHIDSQDVKACVSAAGIFTVYVTSLQIHGILSIGLRASKDTPPFYGGLEIYFLNPPELSIETSGTCSAIPGLQDILRNSLLDVIKNLCVAPNRHVFLMNPDDDLDRADLKYPAPLGLLRMTLISAENLVAADWNVLSPNSSDPFVCIQIGNKTWQSPTIYKSLNPIWMEGNVAEFLVFDDLQQVTFTVFDEDYHSSNDFIGSASLIPIRNLIDEFGKKQSRIPLMLDGDSAGSLQIDARWFSLSPTSPSSDIAAKEGPSQMLVAVKLLGVIGMPKGLDAPFRVCMKMDDCEVLSDRSYPKTDANRAKQFRNICSKLEELHLTEEEICKVLDVTHDEFQLLKKEGDEFNKFKWKLDMMRSQLHPEFNCNMYLLIPNVSDDKYLELSLVDNKSKLIGEVQKVSMGDIIDPAGVTSLDRDLHFTQEICLPSSIRAFFLC